MVMTLLASIRGSRSVKDVLDSYTAKQQAILNTLKRDLGDIIDDRKLTVSACVTVLEETQQELDTAQADIKQAQDKLNELN